MKSIVILGSTGSIGTQTLAVCRMHGFGVKALSASTNTAQLEKQAREFKPEYVRAYSERASPDLLLWFVVLFTPKARILT